MKRWTVILAALVTLGGTAFAQTGAFEKAHAAYDDERYAEAARIYEELILHGVANAEVHYNLANAYFKESDLPNAVWHYRVAWARQPRDPDIQANLRFALNAAGAIEPTPTFVEKTLSTLSRAEWILVAVVGYAALAFLLMLAVVLRRIRRPILKLGLVPVAAIALAAAGWWRWERLEHHPEWVVTRTEATALYGPVEGSTAHFKIPLGALARQKNTDPRGWIELEYDGKRGWIKTDYIKRVSP